MNDQAHFATNATDISNIWVIHNTNQMIATLVSRTVGRIHFTSLVNFLTFGTFYLLIEFSKIFNQNQLQTYLSANSTKIGYVWIFKLTLEATTAAHSGTTSRIDLTFLIQRSTVTLIDGQIINNNNLA